MEFVGRHPRIVLALCALGVVVIVVLSIGQATKQRSAIDTQKETSVKSSFSETTENIAINSDVHSPANLDAVQQPISVFAISDLPIPASVQYSIQQKLPGILSRELIPTYAQTSLQVDRNSIDCPIEYDCAFNFYIDSPERYYHFHVYYQADGSQAYTLQQLPMPGVDK